MSNQTVTFLRSVQLCVRAWGLCLVVAGLLSPADSLRSQQSPGATPQQAERATPRLEVDEVTRTISFSMGDGMKLVDFVRWCQDVTGKPFTFKAEELQQAGDGKDTVRFLGTMRVPKERFVEDFFTFFETMLYTKGLVVVPRGEGDLRVYEVMKAKAEDGAKKGAADAGVTPVLRADGDSISFAIEHDMKLIDFVAWGQELTGKRFTFDRKDLQSGKDGENTVCLLGTFRIPKQRFAEDFTTFFATVLHTKGFDLVTRGEGDLELHEIVRMAGEKKR